MGDRRFLLNVTSFTACDVRQEHMRQADSRVLITVVMIGRDRYRGLGRNKSSRNRLYSINGRVRTCFSKDSISSIAPRMSNSRYFMRSSINKFFSSSYFVEKIRLGYGVFFD